MEGLFFMNYNIILFLARIFGSSARLLSFPTPESYRCTSRIRERQVTKQLTKKTAKKRRRICRYSEHFGLSRIRRDREKESQKYKTNPKRTQTNPIFWRSNPILSPKMRIFDKFRKYFLCKTNPMVCYRYSNRSGV